MPETLNSSESKPESGKRQLPTKIFEPEDELDEEMSLDFAVECHSEEATGISKDDYREMLISAGEHGKTGEIFWNMLVDKVHQTGFELPQGKTVEVLDLACGACEEGRALNSFFGGRIYPGFSPDVNLAGIDVDAESIENAKYNGRVWDEQKRENYLPENMHFIVGDGTRLEDYPEIPKQADVVIIRHQQLVGDPDRLQEESEEIWRKIFSQAFERVRPEGIVIITSHDEYQNDYAKKVLESLSCEIVLDQNNPYARPKESRYSVTDDHRILVVRKNQQITKEDK